MHPVVQRLRERKLVQWAVAYLAAAGVIYSILEGPGSAWGVSDLVLRTAQVVFSAGFLVALALAWYHGEKGEQRISGAELLILGGIMVLGAIGVRLVTVGPAAPRVSNAGAPGPTTYLPLATPPGISLLTVELNPTVAISPDGRRLVLVADSAGRRLYLDELGSAEGLRPLPGTDGAVNPFFSPTGEWVAFVSGDRLRKVSLYGGEPIPLAEVVSAQAFRGGVWGDDDQIYFAPANEGGLQRVHADGGTVASVTMPDRASSVFGHHWPEILPGGRTILYTACCDGAPRIIAYDLESQEETVLHENGFNAKYDPSGRLVFGQRSELLAATFDLGDLSLDVPTVVATNVVAGIVNFADYDLSDAGDLVHLSGSSIHDRRLLRVEHLLQTSEVLDIPPSGHVGVAFAPDGSRLAVTTIDGQTDIHIYDFERAILSPFTSGPALDFNPLWSPDGRDIVFTSTRSGRWDLWIAPADRGQAPRPLVQSEYSKWPIAWSPDGRVLAYGLDHPETGEDIWLYHFAGDSTSAFMAETHDEWSPGFSPDGHWFAYSTKESGRPELWVARWPGPDRGCQVSSAGGREAYWSSDGSRLFFRGSPPEETTTRSDETGRRLDTVMSITAEGYGLCETEPIALLTGVEEMSWAPSPSGDFSVTVEPPIPSRLTLIRNWFSDVESGAND